VAEGGLFLGRSESTTNLDAVSSGEYIMPRELTKETSIAEEFALEACVANTRRPRSSRVSGPS
jgi:hypothetical protein